MDQKKLASRLYYLPLFTPKKIYLWLTYKGIKPASIIPLVREAGPLTITHKNRIFKWLVDAGLYYIFENSNKEKLIISKNKKIIEEISKMKNPLSNKDQHKLGTFLGYPPKAARAYGYDFDSLSKDDDLEPSIKKSPAYLYLGYLARKDHQKEDINTAKKWMAVIREDIFKLAKAFERQQKTQT